MTSKFQFRVTTADEAAIRAIGVALRESGDIFASPTDAVRYALAFAARQLAAQAAQPPA